GRAWPTAQGDHRPRALDPREDGRLEPGGGACAAARSHGPAGDRRLDQARLLGVRPVAASQAAEGEPFAARPRGVRVEPFDPHFVAAGADDRDLRARLEPLALARHPRLADLDRCVLRHVAILAGAATVFGIDLPAAVFLDDLVDLAADPVVPVDHRFQL